jgi:HlyD family secretion protein
MMKTGRIRRIIIAVVLIAVAAVVTVSFLGKSGGGNNELVIDYYRVKTDVMEEKISGTGTFVPRKSATVLAKVSGALKTLYIDEGDRVRAGVIVLEIDAENYEQSLESSQIALESSRRAARQNLLSLRAGYQAAALSHEQAERNYTNNKALFEADGISEEVLKQSLDVFLNSELNLKSARERLNLTMGLPLKDEPVLDDSDDDRIISEFPEIVQAELGIDTARKNLDYCTVRAPITGTVTQVLLDEGRMAGPNTPLVVIEALDDMIAEIQIDEVDIGKIQKNNPAEITSDSLLGKTLRGTVESISPVIQRVGNTRMTEVKVAINPEENRLKSGASCTVRIAATTKDSALVIPLTAYTAEDEETYVYVLEQKPTDPGTFTSPEIEADSGVEIPAMYLMKRRDVEIGIITVNQVEVISGLEDGEMVAMGNQSLYREDLEGRLGEEK